MSRKATGLPFYTSRYWQLDDDKTIITNSIIGNNTQTKAPNSLYAIPNNYNGYSI